MSTRRVSLLLSAVLFGVCLLLGLYEVDKEGWTRSALAAWSALLFVIGGLLAVANVNVWDSTKEEDPDK